MNSNQQHSVIYGHKLNKARCITSVLGDTEHDRFLVGTLSLHSDNEVHLIEYQEDQDDIKRVGFYSHPHEIWNISPCPSKPNLFFTVYHNGKHFESSLWKLPASIYGDNDNDDDDMDENDTENADNKKKSIRSSSDPHADKHLQEIAIINGGGGNSQQKKVSLKTVLWEPSGLLDRVLSIDNESVKEWKIEQLLSSSSSAAATNASSATNNTTTTLSKPSQVYNVKAGQNKLFTGRWDPNHSEKVALAASSKIIELDLRSNGKASVIDNAHEQQVRCLEYNAYRPYYLVSGGDDCKMKFWDMRMTGNGPLRTVCGHSHWITQVAFNPLYDQLVLSSSTDSLVNLWSIPSISSKSIAKKMDMELNQLDDEDNDNNVKSPHSAHSDDEQHQNKFGENGNDDEDHGEPLIDSLVCSIDEHEESVYSVAWSSGNKWVFGSVSYDGRVLVHTVPQSEKWKIIHSE